MTLDTQKDGEPEPTPEWVPVKVTLPGSDRLYTWFAHSRCGRTSIAGYCASCDVDGPKTKNVRENFANLDVVEELIEGLRALLKEANAWRDALHADFRSEPRCTFRYNSGQVCGRRASIHLGDILSHRFVAAYASEPPKMRPEALHSFDENWNGEGAAVTREGRASEGEQEFDLGSSSEQG